MFVKSVQKHFISLNFRNPRALEAMDKYDVIKVVGEGAFGRVYLAKGRSDSKHCVIKEINCAKVQLRNANSSSHSEAYSAGF